jgi:predicted metal-dependent peptidase
MAGLKQEDRFPELVEALSTLSWSYPFWATLIYDMLSLVVSREYPTLAVGGGKLYINPDYFINELTPMNRLSGIGHECGHEMFMHPEKMRGYQKNGFDGEPFDSMRYNMAGDYVINDMLKVMGVGELHRDWLWSAHIHYEDGVDDVYRRLKPKEPPPGGGGDQGDPNDSSCESGDGEGPASPAQQYDILDKEGNVVDETPSMGAPQDTHLAGEDSPHTEQDWKQAVASANAAAKAIGKGSSRMDKFVDDYIDTKRPWDKILRDLIVKQRGRDRRNNHRINKRKLHQYKLVVPTKHSHKIGDVLIVDDVSGSVSQHETTLFKSAVTEIFLDCRPKSIRVLCVSSTIHSDDTFTSVSDFEQWQPTGSGGTDMEAGFRHVADDPHYKPHVAIVLTDGHTFTYAGNEPPYPVIWVSTQRAADTFAYGKVVMMDDV